MFNLLGNLLGFGYQKEQEGDELQNEATINTDQSTQTFGSDIVGQQNIELKHSNVKAKSNIAGSPADWVIVDRSEEAEKCKNELSGVRNDSSMIQSTLIGPHLPTSDFNQQEIPAYKKSLTDSVDNNAFLGSFFEKNSQEDEAFNLKYVCSDKENRLVDNEDEDVQVNTTKDWLITPLPCLTSITASQRAIVENDPLENLLIEHPSMSVFVAATSSDTSFIQEEDEDMQVEDVVIALKEKNIEIITHKVVSEKRKVHISPKLSEQVQLQSPRHKKGKKNKKSTNVSPSVLNTQLNKENNVQPQNQQILTADYFKKQQQAANNLARLETLLFNKKQMKRANKNANQKQRKYHKLQQPAFLTSKPVF